MRILSAILLAILLIQPTSPACDEKKSGALQIGKTHSVLIQSGASVRGYVSKRVEAWDDTKKGAGKMAITGSHFGSYPISIEAGTLAVDGAAQLNSGTFSSFPPLVAARRLLAASIRIRRIASAAAA